jgi:hypothetical protein
LLLLIGVACVPQTSAPPRLSATGVVIAADGPSAAQVDRFTIRTAEGQSIEFTVGVLEQIGGGLPAPHLREHLVSGVPITVDYKVSLEDGAKVAIRYIDAIQ